MAPTNHQNNIFYLSAPSQREREWIARYPLGWCIKQNIHTSTYLSVYIAITCSSALPLFLFQHLTTLFLCYSPPVCSSVTMSFTYSVPLCLYVILASVSLLLFLYILCYHVFMSFWLHKCKVFLWTSYFVGNLWVASWAISSLFVSHV